MTTTTYPLTLFVIADDDTQIAAIPLILHVEVTPGEPEFLPYGRHTEPDEYDPGSGDEIALIRVTRENGQTATALEIGWATKWLLGHRDDVAREVLEREKG